MAITQADQNFLNFNALQTKNVVIVVDIPGLDIISNTVVYTKIRYGDPIHYGDAGLVYGGLRLYGTPGGRGQKNLLSLDGSLTIYQTLEPEQGRGAISTISLSFVDVANYMTQATSPGVIIPDILGAPVRVWLGYQ